MVSIKHDTSKKKAARNRETSKENFEERNKSLIEDKLEPALKIE